jgi:uncharacterized protein YcbK (DUF882 family)
MRQFVLIVVSMVLLTSCDPPRENTDADQFAEWQQKNRNAAKAESLKSYLDMHGVGQIIPIRQLLRSDTNWRRCKAEPFSVPPRKYWPNMIATLRLIRDEIVPLIGPVEAQSVYREPEINACIKGASRSFHLQFHAIDLRPEAATTRAHLMAKLCRLHSKKGARLNMGLGIYKATRFHIDAAGFRGWGQDYRTASFPCRHNVAPQRNLG